MFVLVTDDTVGGFITFINESLQSETRLEEGLRLGIETDTNIY